MDWTQSRTGEPIPQSMLTSLGGSLEVLDGSLSYSPGNSRKRDENNLAKWLVLLLRARDIDRTLQAFWGFLSFCSLPPKVRFLDGVVCVLLSRWALSCRLHVVLR